VAQLNELMQSIDIKVCSARGIAGTRAYPNTQGEHTSLMAKLAVHAAQTQLGSDMFLSSLAESSKSRVQRADVYLTGHYLAAITIPMRVSPTLSKSTREILGSFGNAEALLLSTLDVTFERGHICQVRDAAVSLATISALQAALGKKAATAGHVAAGLLSMYFFMDLAVYYDLMPSYRSRIIDDTRTRAPGCHSRQDDRRWYHRRPPVAFVHPSRNNSAETHQTKARAPATLCSLRLG